MLANTTYLIPCALGFVINAFLSLSAFLLEEKGPNIPLFFAFIWLILFFTNL
jgi:hypothetical protein